MSYSPEVRERAKELRQKGYTQGQAVAELVKEFKDYPRIEELTERTLRNWERKWNGGKAEAEKGGTVLPAVTFNNLASLYPVAAVPYFWLGMEAAAKEGSDRLHRFVKAMLELRDGEGLPQPWLAAVAVSPILAEDLNAPAFSKLADVVRETRPFTGRGERRSYHSRMGLLLRELYGQVAQWSISWGYGLFPRGPAARLSSLEELAHYEPAQKEIKAQEDALLNGKTELFVEKGMPPIEDTIPGSVLEFISRLPDLDRQKGKVAKVKLPLEALLFRLLGDIPRLLKLEKGGQP